MILIIFAATFFPSLTEYYKSPYLRESECETEAVAMRNVFQRRHHN